MKFLALEPDDEIVKTFSHLDVWKKKLSRNTSRGLSAMCIPTGVPAGLSHTYDGSFSGQKALKVKNSSEHQTPSGLTLAELISCPDETNHTKIPDEIFHSPMTMGRNMMPMESCRRQ